MFFAMGWEHLVVNMFIIPSAMIYGANITLSDWWIGNELPVTIGNFVGGFLFTGAAIAFMYGTRGRLHLPLRDERGGVAERSRSGCR